VELEFNFFLQLIVLLRNDIVLVMESSHRGHGESPLCRSSGRLSATVGKEAVRHLVVFSATPDEISRAFAVVAIDK